MTIRDIPVVAQGWYQEKAKTCFAQLKVDWTVEGCAAYLTHTLSNPRQLTLVDEHNGVIRAVCGAVVQQDLLPPHPVVVGEWMWYGTDKRAIVQVLHAAHAWGKQQGATLARYILNQPGQSPTKFTETYRWEVL